MQPQNTAPDIALNADPNAASNGANPHDAHFRYWPKGLPHDVTRPRGTLYDNLAIAAARFPDKPAIVFYGTVISYVRLKAEVDALAGYLQTRAGVARGDRVLLLSQNCPQFIVAYYAVLRADAVVVPVNAMSTPDELAHYLQDSGARVAFAAQELCERLRDFCGTGADAGVAAEGLRAVIVHAYGDYLGTGDGDPQPPEWLREPRRTVDLPGGVAWRDALDAGARPGPAQAGGDDLCLLPYTSGTTGRPKGCRHTHGTVNAALYATQLWRGLTPETVVLGVAPMFHLLGMQNSMNLPIVLGGTSVLLPRWDRVAAARLVERHRISMWAAAPTMIVDFFAQPGIEGFDLTSLSLLAGGGAAMPEAVSAMLSERYGIVFNEAYGLTETAAFLHCNPLHRSKRQCIGVPTFGVQTRVIDPGTLQETPIGQQGEIVTRGAQIMLGYWNNPKADADAFVTLQGQRYFRTGDLGHVDEEGYFFLTDRLKRMINANGYKVWPAEVENTLYRHPAVQEACVIGVPDPARGETVKALLVLRPGANVQADEFIAWAREHMAAYKVPRIVECVTELPKSSTGKLLWRKLQEEARVAVAPII